jgi:Asp/Glu/hydantoin racemase
LVVTCGQYSGTMITNEVDELQAQPSEVSKLAKQQSSKANGLELSAQKLWEQLRGT